MKKSNLKCVIIATVATVLAMTFTSCSDNNDYTESESCISRTIAITEAYDRALQDVDTEEQKRILYEQFQVDLLNACQ